jgi:putative acyl-CoA dehydrogenase
MARSPESIDALLDEIDASSSRLGDAVRKELVDLDDVEWKARRLVETLAVALQSSLLDRFGDPAVADAFRMTRIDGDHGRAFGSLPTGVDADRIIGRHLPLAS